jgi:hypothetical protein
VGRRVGRGDKRGPSALESEDCVRTTSSRAIDDRWRALTDTERPASVERLEEEHSDLVAQRASELQAAADGDHRNGAPRGRAYVRRLQELAIDDPDMGIAVGRSLHLEHVVEELLAGISVDGVPGIGPDGHELPPNRRHTARRRGAWMLALSALLLLVEAVIADGIGSILLYIWTVVGLGTFFLGGYLVLLGDKTPQAPS